MTGVVDFGDPRAFSDLGVGVVGRGPHLVRDQVHRVDESFGEGEPERILHPAGMALVDELPGRNRITAGSPGPQYFRCIRRQRGHQPGQVGSDVTGPNMPGWVRNSATSAAQSPPTAIARSSTILPGLWAARGLCHGANAFDRPVTRPIFSAVRTSNSEPACDTEPDAFPSAASRKYHLGSLTQKRSAHSTLGVSNCCR